MLDALLEQRAALARQPPAILGLGAGRLHHGANLPFASCPGHECAQQRLAIDAVGLGTAVTTVHRDRSGVDNVALDSVLDEQPMKPESVKPGLLNDSYRDRRAGLPGS